MRKKGTGPEGLEVRRRLLRDEEAIALREKKGKAGEGGQADGSEVSRGR